MSCVGSEECRVRLPGEGVCLKADREVGESSELASSCLPPGPRERGLRAPCQRQPAPREALVKV